MFTQRINSKTLQHRLDSWFYNPEALAIDNTLEQLANCCQLKDLVDQKRKITNGVRGPDWSNSKYKLIRLQDCKDWIVDDDNAASISVEQYLENKRCALKENDIVVAIGGYVGNASIVTNSVTAVIGQHSAMLSHSPEGVVDSRYLLAYLNTFHAETIFDRYVSGTVQAGVNLEDLRELPAPIFDLLAQKYIGDKVRQAEQLRAWAKQLQVQIKGLSRTSTIEHALTIANRKSSWTPSADLTARLDPKYYSSKGLAVLHATADSSVTLRELVVGICNGFEEREFFEDGITYITVSEVSSGRLDVSSAPKIHPSTNIPSKARVNDKCVLVVRTGSIGTAVKVDQRDKDAVISSHLIKLEFEKEEAAAAVASFLNSEAGKVLLHKISYGAVQPQIGQDELLALPIPKDIINQAEELLSLTSVYEDSIRLAKSLVLTAKILVEVLIEGQFTEQLLIDAQKAIEAGDTSLDREILARLTTKGLDGDGDPLFSDLDQLYELLAQSQSLDE